MEVENISLNKIQFSSKAYGPYIVDVASLVGEYIVDFLLSQHFSITEPSKIGYELMIEIL